MLSQHERMADVLNRPGVYGIYRLEQALAFFGGFNAAAELGYFRGFEAWLARNGGPGPNLAWPYQAEKVVAARAAEQADEVEEFFAPGTSTGSRTCSPGLLAVSRSPRDG
ncbi:hypothetical protein ACFXPA_14430 [Amycolatopsis sp. NPDC059090]|uniref:hypothetical protein n=1 Tax=unclassified Amycolatopsis TaxID=2618356 RepID=UPI00366EE324